MKSNCKLGKPVGIAPAEFNFKNVPSGIAKKAIKEMTTKATNVLGTALVNQCTWNCFS